MTEKQFTNFEKASDCSTLCFENPGSYKRIIDG